MDIVAVFVIGFVASYVSGLVGGGGLISIPALIFLGIPPQAAIATNGLGGYGHGIGSTYKYFKAKKIAWEYFWLLLAIGLVGGIIGASILVSIDKDTMLKIVGGILLVYIPLLIVKKNLGVKRLKPTRKNKVKGSIAMLFCQIYHGFFGGGTAFFSIPVLMHYFGLTTIEANATRVPPSLFYKIGALWVFFVNGLLLWDIAAVLFVSELLGSYAGAHTAVKKGNETVKKLFVAYVAFSAVKMLFF